jgi:hypothetical protein
MRTAGLPGCLWIGAVSVVLGALAFALGSDELFAARFPTGALFGGGEHSLAACWATPQSPNKTCLRQETTAGISASRRTYSRRAQPNLQPPLHFRRPRSPQLSFAPANEKDTFGPFCHVITITHLCFFAALATFCFIPLF